MNSRAEQTSSRGLVAAAKKQERKRIQQIIENETRHYGQTHYVGINCIVCNIHQAIEGAEDAHRPDQD